MERRTHIGITDLDSHNLCSLINALDNAVDDTGNVTIGAVADLMARVCHGLDEPRPCA